MNRLAAWATVTLLAALATSKAWRSTAHRIINQHAVDHLPTLMSQLTLQQSFLAAHASDADRRKSSDTVYYIDDPYAFVFQYVLRSNGFVDFILKADGQ